METSKCQSTSSRRYVFRKEHLPNWAFVLWAGGAALFSYSLVYALRKPFTAAEFEGLTVAGMDFKVAVSIIQLIGYVCAKMLGIKYISELRPGGRLKFIIGSAALSEASLLAFAIVPLPWNVVALFFNGLSLGCMWGVIFSFLEGRRTTDILAAIMGVSMALSSGVAKSLGLYALNDWHVDEFWMPALIGAFAFPLLSLLGWIMTKLPQPTTADIEARSKRYTLNGHERWQLFRRFMSLLIVLFGANLLLTVQRDIKEDFLVCIIDVSQVTSWTFARIDTVATLVLLGLFALLSTVRSHLLSLCTILAMATIGSTVIALLGATGGMGLPIRTWLFLQTFCIDLAYLSFQTIFFERFIACFKIHGNVGFFIITIDFIGYLGTLSLLLFKEFATPHVDWTTFYNHMSFYIGLACSLGFIFAIVYMAMAKWQRENTTGDSKQRGCSANEIILTTSQI